MTTNDKVSNTISKSVLNREKLEKDIEILKREYPALNTGVINLLPHRSQRWIRKYARKFGIWRRQGERVGRRFGKLTVLEPVKIEGRKRMYYKCICDCGNTKLIHTSALVRTNSCGCSPRDISTYKTIEGCRFGRLIALKRIRRIQSGKRKATFYLCRCDCGTELEVRYNSLKNGTISCGCLLQDMLSARAFPTEITATTKAYNYIKRNASSRNIAWDLTHADVAQLIFKECYYCGDAGSNTIRLPGRKNTAVKPFIKQEYREQ